MEKEKHYDFKDLVMTSVAFGLVIAVTVIGIGGYLLYTKKVSVLSAQTAVVNGAASTQEALVTGAIEHANPAVVSIIITKDVPVMERYYERIPFGDGTVLRVPQVRQNGTQEREVGGGSGFLVSADGLIVTNKHVVEDTGASYTVFTNDGKKYDVSVVARDPSLDIAVLKVKDTAPSGGFPYLTFGDSSILKLGQSAIAIGNALGEFRNSVSVGVISGLARQVTAGDDTGRSEELENVIQTDAAINSGNSGGPLLDLHGQVVGVNVAVASNAENIGFALPADAVKTVVSSVQQFGEIRRPYLGVRYVAINAQLATENKLSVDYGAYIQAGDNGEQAVLPHSPAAKAGLKAGDSIISINGVSLKDQSLASVVRTLQIGQTVTVEYMRGAQKMTANVTLEKAPTQ